MKFPILLLFLGILFSVSCKKEKKKQYSTWYVNDKSFSTNEVIFSSTKNGNSIDAISYVNGFSIYNSGAGFYPQFGVYLLSADYESHDPTLLHALFYYNSNIYYQLPSNADTLMITMVKDKFRYEIYPAWFVNKNNPNDSVLISGIFNEP